MPEITGTRRILFSAQVAFRRRAVEIFTDVARQCASVLILASDDEGVIPVSEQVAVSRQITNLIDRVFVVDDGRTVFTEQGVALSPFAEALNEQLLGVTWGVIQKHQEWMRRVLPDDVRELLEPADYVGEQGPEDDDPLEGFVVRPFGDQTLSNRAQSQLSAERRRLAEEWQQLRLFSPNPLAQYEWAHTWVDPNGYRLSDRIWEASIRTRVKVNKFLADSIAQGWSAERIARRLEQFLVPGRAQVRTNKPYGVDASFDAMRIARTEITRAHSVAAYTVARTNPYVDSMIWRLSGSHPKPDICDDLAAGSPYDINQTVPLPVQDSHPHCLCTVSPQVGRPIPVVTEEIRQAVLEARQGLVEVNITPLQAEELFAQLVGRQLVQLFLQGLASAA